MKYLLFTGLLFSNLFISAQNWDFSVYSTTKITNHNSSEFSNHSRLSFGLRSNYNFNSQWSLGTEINYSNHQFILRQDDNGVTPLGTSQSYQSNLDMQTIGVPIKLQYKTKKGWYFSAGVGVNYNFKLKSNTKLITSFDNSNDTFYESIDPLSIDYGENINLYYELAVGKEFKIGKVNLFAEIFHQNNFREKEFSFESPTNGSIISQEFLQQNLGFRIGIRF